ncbi:MAG: secretin N-terminal domain-containing protein, partial [Elusimicrobiota bacterium]
MAAHKSAEAERPPSESEQQIGETPMEPEAEQEPAADSRTQGMQIGASSARRSASVESGDLLETRIVVRVKSAPLAAFLDSISAQAKINFIITEGLEEKRITAFLQGVTVREALQILLEMKGLTYQRIGKSNTYVVSPRAKGTTNRITRIYTLSFIPLMDMAQGSGGADQSAGSSGGGGGGGASMPGLGAALGGAGSGPAAGGSQQQGGISILGVIKSVLSKEHGALAVDARTNALIITDVPEVFPQVEQILAELDKKSPQIMIEAQIVEIDSDRAQNLGLEWGGANGELGIFQGPIRDTTFPLNLPKNLSNTHIFDPLNNVVSAVGQGAAGGATAGEGGGGGGGRQEGGGARIG